MQSIELAWAAGFFDGEGSTLVDRMVPGAGHGQPRLRLAMELTQVDERPLQRFAAAVGSGRVRARPERVRPGRHDQASWRWRASDAAAEAALVRLWPYLSAPKREQATRVVDALELDRAVRNASAQRRRAA
jgi:hypothetical protein